MSICAEFSTFVIEAIKDTDRFPWRKGYARRKPTDKPRRMTGVLRPIVYKGKLIATPFTDSARKGASHCVGATLGAFFDAYERYHQATGKPFMNGLNAKEVDELHQIWFVCKGNTGAQGALTRFKLGRAIKSIDDARPGDFLQFGHSAIFFGWLDAEHTKFSVWESNVGSRGKRGGIQMRTWTVSKFRTKKYFIGRCEPS